MIGWFFIAGGFIAVGIVSLMVYAQVVAQIQQAVGA